MNLLRKTAVWVCILAVAQVAWAQAEAKAPPKAGPILEAIPSGTAGFLIVNNLEETLTAVQQYLKDIGVAEMLPIPPDLLTALKGAGQLGEGFNPKGGLAIVVLDPTPLEIDLAKMIEAGRPPKPEELPIVVFVPGGSIQEVFGAYIGEDAPAGEVVDLKFPGTAVQAAQIGGYIALSPNPKALASVMKARKTAATEMPKEQIAVLGRMHLGVYVNMKVAGPLYMKFLQKATEMMGQGRGMPGPLGPMMKAYMGVYQDVIKQVQGVGMGLRFTKTGLVIEEVATMVPDSVLGKAMAACAGRGPAKLDRLPNLPYVLAVGAVAGGAESAEADTAMLDAFLKAFNTLPEGLVAKLKRVNTEMETQVTSSQVVIGGAPAGSGLFGFSCVMSCKDSDKLKASLAETTDVVQEMIKALIPDEDVAKLQIAYAKGAAKSGSLSVDAIEVRHPQMDSMGEDEKGQMAKVLGEGKIRLLVAAPDKNTVVVTFGGGTAFLAEALKVAGGGGTIPKDEGVVEMMQILPKNPLMVGVIDVRNLLSVVRKGAETMGAGDAFPPIALTAKTPIGIGAAASGSSAHAVICVPNDLVKEVIGIVMQFVGGRGGRAEPAPAPGGETF